MRGLELFKPPGIAETIDYPNERQPADKGRDRIKICEDTDGDGRADVKRVLFTGFREGNQQHRLNGFELGLDNWIYGASSYNGGDVRRADAPDAEPISVRNRDFRFHPDTGEFTPLAGDPSPAELTSAIEAALASSKQNKEAAASLLGISRAQLYRELASIRAERQEEK